MSNKEENKLGVLLKDFEERVNLPLLIEKGARTRNSSGFSEVSTDSTLIPGPTHEVESTSKVSTDLGRS
jgi:hypothetical protein